MRILVVGPSLFLPWVEYTARALRRLEHSVALFRSTNILVDRLTLRKGRQWAQGAPAVSAALDRIRAGWHELRDRRLLALAGRFQPELILLMHGESLSAPFLQALKARARCPVAAWWVDNPFRHPIADLFPLYDALYIFDRSYIGPLRQAGARDVRFLPCCCDERVYRPRELTPAQRRRYGSGIALIAWCYDRRVEVAQALSDLPLKIWGRGWAPSEVRSRLNGSAGKIPIEERFVPDEEAALIYSGCQIGLNVHADQTRVAGLNTRSFELLAAGAFELTDAVQGMEEMLAPGKEVAVYHSPQEAREMAGYYLSHPEERAAMAARGRERVTREHTYLHRMKTLLASAPR